jgi:hypothetical protein
VRAKAVPLSPSLCLRPFPGDDDGDDDDNEEEVEVETGVESRQTTETIPDEDGADEAKDPRTQATQGPKDPRTQDPARL